MEQQDSFGNWLRRKRKALDWTQADLANRVGCSAAMIRKIEAEERYPSVQIAGKLADIFGIPAKERGKFQKFSRGESLIRIAEADENLPWQGSRQAPRLILPWPATSLIGREREIADLRAYLSNPAVRLVTLVGPPGIGKTRLSIAVARSTQSTFADGISYIPLSDLDDTSDDSRVIAGLIMQILDYVKIEGVPENKQLVKAIREKEMLLIMDNCEHLIENVVSLIAELIESSPRLKVLATSRETLRIPGEWLYPVRPLAIPAEQLGSSAVEVKTDTWLQYPALELFTERARSVCPDFQLTLGNVQAVASLCECVDGLPLGIELIAARVRWMSPQALLHRMHDQTLFTVEGGRMVSQRQKSLQNAIHWSYHLLSVEEQRLFAYFSVFSGGFSMRAAEKLALHFYPNHPPYELVVSLQEKSLLQAADSTIATVEEPRFTLLRTIHQYAAMCLEQKEEKNAAQDWHLGYFLDLAEQADGHRHFSDQLDWFNTIEREHENFRAALNWGIAQQKTEHTLRLLAALGWVWMVRGHYREMAAYSERAMQLPDAVGYPTLYGQILYHLGRHDWLNNKPQQGRALLEESRAILQKGGDEAERNLAETLVWLVITREANQNIAQARSLIHQSLALFQKWEDAWGIALATFNLGSVEEGEGHLDTAHSLYNQSLGLFRDLGDPLMISRLYLYLSAYHRKQGDSEKARQYFDQHILLDTQLQFWSSIADVLRDLGYLYHQQGDYDQANELYEKSLAVSEAHGIDPFDSLLLYARLALDWGEAVEATRRFVQLLNWVWKSDERDGMIYPFAGIACAAVKNNLFEQAALLFGVVEMLADQPMAKSEYFPLSGIDQYRQQTREHLDEEWYKRLVKKGQSMNIEESVAFCLAVLS